MKPNLKTLLKCETYNQMQVVTKEIIEELQQLKQHAKKLMEDKDITRFARERGSLSLSDRKVTIPIDEILGETQP